MFFPCTAGMGSSVWGPSDHMVCWWLSLFPIHLCLTFPSHLPTLQESCSSCFLLCFPKEKLPFDFPLSICKICHTPRDAFDITSSYFTGNHYTAGSPKRSSYVAERTHKRQNKFTNLFYRFKFNLFVLGTGRRLTQRN